MVVRRSERIKTKTVFYKPKSLRPTTRKTSNKKISKTTIKDTNNINIIQTVIDKNKKLFTNQSNLLNLDSIDEVKKLLTGISLGIDEDSNINMIILFAKHINNGNNNYNLNDTSMVGQLCDIVNSVLKKSNIVNDVLEKPKFNWGRKINDLKNIREKRNRLYKIFTNDDLYKQHIKTTIKKNMNNLNVKIPLDLNDSKQVQLVLLEAIHQGCKSLCRELIIYFAKFINKGHHIYDLNDENMLDIFCDIVWNIVKPAKEQRAITKLKTAKHKDKIREPIVVNSVKIELDS